MLVSNLSFFERIVISVIFAFLLKLIAPTFIDAYNNK